MSSAALCELYDEMDSLVRELSEELVLELARRDELGYEKELKNQFISLLLSVQRRHRALIDSKLRGGSGATGAGSSKSKDTPCTGGAQPGCVSLFATVLLFLLLMVWRSGSIVCRINKVTLCRAQLVLGWVTIFGWVHHLNHVTVLRGC